MGKRAIKTFEVGQLVEWYEPYADGLMTKDAGYGIVLKRMSYDLGFEDDPYINYEVFRTKHNDTMRFEPGELVEVVNE